MSDTKEFKLTPGRIVILRALEAKPLKWAELRKEYFGPERAKAPASTAFHMQLTKMVALGVVTKGVENYSLSETGASALESARAAGNVDIAGARSNADREYVAPATPAA